MSWLGNLNHLTPISDFSEPPYGEDDSRTPFPVRPKEKRSYAQSCVVWIKAVGLQVKDACFCNSYIYTDSGDSGETVWMNWLTESYL